MNVLFVFFLFYVQVSCVLDETKDPKEHIVRVYGNMLTREDFLTLGLQNDVEAMVKQ